MATLRKPMINANAPIDVIVSQIRSYLYQFSDDVAFAFDSGMASGSSVRTEADIQAIAAAVRTTLRLGSDKIADFVVDNGMTDGWTWRKWSSGASEASINVSKTIDAWNNSDGVYTFDCEAAELPDGIFETDSTPMIFVDIAGIVGTSGTSELVFPYNARIETNSETNEAVIKFGVYAVSKTVEGNPTSPAVPLVLSVNIMAVGKWK